MNWKTLFNRTKGDYWEQYARQFLKNEGLVFIKKNFHSRFGEIDMIMQDKQTFVFVEVKFRSSSGFGGAVASVTAKKQQKLTKTATIYLQQAQLNAYNTPCRFDIVAIEGNQHTPEVTWLKNAF